MKYALIFFAFIFSLQSFSSNAFARQISSIAQSDAINQIIVYVNDNREEFSVFFRLSDKSFQVKSEASCVKVSSNDVVKEVKKSFDIILQKYPDEELPFAEAVSDLKDFLDGRHYLRCEKNSVNLNKDKINSIFYVSEDDEPNKIFLRMDNIAPSFR